jgi:hypothetical protein
MGALTGKYNKRYLELRTTEDAVSLFFYKNKKNKKGLEFKTVVQLVLHTLSPHVARSLSLAFSLARDHRQLSYPFSPPRHLGREERDQHDQR